MAVSFARDLAIDYLNRVLWTPTCGAYKEAIGRGTPRCQNCAYPGLTGCTPPSPDLSLPSGDGWPCWCNDNYLARVVALKYMPDRVPALSTFLGTYRDARWCLFTPSWSDYVPAQTCFGSAWQDYANLLALEAIYYSLLGRSASAIINKLISFFDGMWFNDAATSINGHETYKCALGSIAFSLHGQGTRAQQCLRTVDSQQIQTLSHPEYGGVLTDDWYIQKPGEYRTYANTETTCLAILAHDRVSGGMNVLPLALVGALSVGALMYYRQRSLV